MINGFNPWVDNRPVIDPRTQNVPSPDTDDAVEWWYEQADADLNRVINILANLASKGVKWANDLGDRLIADLG